MEGRKFQNFYEFSSAFNEMTQNDSKQMAEGFWFMSNGSEGFYYVLDEGDADE